MSEPRKIKRALISISDKSGIVEFASLLAELDAVIISTGGTAKLLRDNGLDVTDVSEVTDFPEMMGGRVKTLHPKIHGGFLALRDNKEHLEAMRMHGIEPIDLAVVNLYPFEETIAKEGVSIEDAVENIDIGGPAMIRSASKNWRDVAVVTDRDQYPEIIRELRETEGSLSLETRQQLAAAAFRRTAAYDGAIASFLTSKASPDNELFPELQHIDLAKVADLRYGENPHQKAALYEMGRTGGIAHATQLHGKEMSFNNYVDAEAAWNLVGDFDELAVAIIKHTNPSGLGLGTTNDEAFQRALSTDPVSAFGGIIAFNRKVDAKVAVSINTMFVEVVIAPDFDDDALSAFRSKKNLRVLRMGDAEETGSVFDYKQISGGMLVQEQDKYRVTENDLTVVTQKQPGRDEIEALLLAWRVCKNVKSNAIVFANQHQTLGVGAGQMNRVDSVRIAATRAERFDLPLSGSVLASDAFFPFRDNIDEAAKYGVSAIIQPGGSVKDSETIAAADEHGISMVFTGYRHFKH